jgi:hypothetical protein
MNIKECYISLLDKCNKLSTNTNTKIEYHVAVRAINEAQSYWYDIRLKKVENDTTIQRELYHLLRTQKLNINNSFKEYNTYTLPENYYHISQVKAIGKSNSCELPLDVFLTENTNINELYLNDQFAPSLEWQQTLATFREQDLIVYHNNFKLDIEIDYYKKLSKVDIKSNYIHIDGTESSDIDLEFEGSSAYEILNLAAMLITGNVSDPSYQVHLNSIKNFE